jgi:LmbE family N-acetylglucosaminyl deacetylase
MLLEPKRALLGLFFYLFVKTNKTCIMKNQKAAAHAFGVRSGERAFVIHAHPDDEAVFTGAAIRGLAMAGVILHGIIAADGEKSTKSPKFSRQRRRVAEVATAYEVVGNVPGNRLHHLRLPDDQLPQYIGRVARRIVKLIDTFQPTTLITAGGDGFGHSDHSAVHEAAVLANQFIQRKSGNPPVLWALQANGIGEIEIPVDYDKKMEGVLAHQSQFPSKINADGTLVIPQFTMDELTPYKDLLYSHEAYSRVPI